MPNFFNGWIASLSNGDTVFERPPKPGEKSSWQQLLDRCQNGLQITQLRLQRVGVQITCDGHRGVRGYVMAYEALEMMFRGTSMRVQGVGTIVGDLVFMTWLDNSGNVRQDIRPLSEMKVHSTLRDIHGESDRPNSSSGSAN